MPYSPWDEYFIHQLPRTFDHVHDSDPNWSDRCYFNVHSPDGALLVTTGYGNNPNLQRGHGYVKVALADGRHWDLDAVRKVDGDRGDLYAGPMRWKCVEPLERWILALGPNASGIEYELQYKSRAPMWELLPITIRKAGRTVVDMTHIKQPATFTGWVSIDGERTSVDGFHGGRDRTIGVRMSDQIEFWIWFEAGFADRAIEAWVWESDDGAVQYVDGGVTYEDGRQSKRFVSFEHSLIFDGDGKRPLSAEIVFTDEEGHKVQVRADSPQPEVGVYYGPFSRIKRADDLSYAIWDSTADGELAEIESKAMALDQLMRFECDGMTGSGIFELMGRGSYTRYAGW